MNRLALSRRFSPSVPCRRGYTLVEILVATTLSLMILGAVVQLFGTVGNTITQSRSILESADRLRSAQTRLQMDLEGLTVTPMPPRKPEFNEGYLEIIEGPIMQGPNGVTGSPQPVDSDKSSALDTSVGDFDDILMFTTRTTGKPFVGRFGGTAVESDVAEVAWFIRGRDLHRRVLLVAPGIMAPQPAANAPGFYLNNDISLRLQGTQLVPNTLSDLTRRECRFAHATAAFPYHTRGWGQYGLPTLRECSMINNTTSSKTWAAGTWYFPAAPSPRTNVDFWTNVAGSRLTDDGLTLASGMKNPGDNVSERIADDIILTNVIGFDVKVWDPGAKQNPLGVILSPNDPNFGNPNNTTGVYVDLGYAPVPPLTTSSMFYHLGDSSSGLAATAASARVYDTWSTTHEAPRAGDGFDNNSIGIVDNDAEKYVASTYGPPPYAAPLRGIQVKIRIFEPDSRQIREVTVEQDFLPK